jgi:hypothetical protein
MNTKPEIEKVRELIIDIRAHVEMDREITLCGNGTNCCEALNVARALEKIVGKVNDKQVQKRVKELQKMYG